MLLRHFSKFTNHFEPRERTADKPAPKPPVTPTEADKDKPAADVAAETPPPGGGGGRSYGIAADDGKCFTCSEETSVTIRTGSGKNGVLIFP